MASYGIYKVFSLADAVVIGVAAGMRPPKPEADSKDQGDYEADSEDALASEAAYGKYEVSSPSISVLLAAPSAS